MIEPSEKDIGRKVIYTGNYGGPAEEGVITSFNDAAVFVRYGADCNSKATSHGDLEWLYPNSKGPRSERCPTCGDHVESIFDHLPCVDLLEDNLDIHNGDE